MDRDADSVLGGAVQRGLQPREVNLVWKLLGYLAGPHVLNAMTGHISNPIWANRAEDALAYFQDTAINVTKKKDAVGVTNMKHLPPLDTCAAELQSDALMLTAVGMEMPGAEFSETASASKTSNEDMNASVNKVDTSCGRTMCNALQCR